MNWSIKDLARMSGATPRMLRHYDEIGLLVPAWVGTNGYRYYEYEQLARLQQILVLRELDLGLEMIAGILDGEYDRLDALRRHHRRLLAERARFGALAHTVAKTITHLQGGTIMSRSRSSSSATARPPLSPKRRYSVSLSTPASAATSSMVTPATPRAANRALRGGEHAQPADVEDHTGELLPDKAAAIVTYCFNPACQNSTQVAVKLERLGYANVRKYPGGIEDWVGCLAVHRDPGTHRRLRAARM